jgi:hypothetical protein
MTGGLVDVVMDVKLMAACVPGGGYGTAGAQDDLALVEVGVRCSLEQVHP